MTSVLYIDYDNSLKTGMDIRLCEKENFSPLIVHSGLFEDFAAGHAQVLIDFLGSPVWINVPKHKIISVKGAITGVFHRGSWTLNSLLYPTIQKNKDITEEES